MKHLNAAKDHTSAVLFLIEQVQLNPDRADADLLLVDAQTNLQAAFVEIASALSEFSSVADREVVALTEDMLGRRVP